MDKVDHVWIFVKYLKVAKDDASEILRSNFIFLLFSELNDALKHHETDLVVIEGMGRALHTNFYAKFKCETLKLVVIKNQWLAKSLFGGDIFSVILQYEKPAICC